RGVRQPAAARGRHGGRRQAGTDDDGEGGYLKHMHESVKIALIGIAVICVGVFIAACRKRSSAEKLTSAGSVYFNIRQLSAVDSSEGQVVTWLVTHNKSGKGARFRMELTLKAPKP